MQRIRSRRGAALALAEIGPPAAVAIPRLRELLNDSDEEVRKAAREAIDVVTGKAPPKPVRLGFGAEKIMDSVPRGTAALTSQ